MACDFPPHTTANPQRLFAVPRRDGSSAFFASNQGCCGRTLCRLGGAKAVEKPGLQRRYISI